MEGYQSVRLTDAQLGVTIHAPVPIFSELLRQWNISLQQPASALGHLKGIVFNFRTRMWLRGIGRGIVCSYERINSGRLC